MSTRTSSRPRGRPATPRTVAQLTHSETATSLRVRDGGRVITDGPFMETKEHLLGFYLIDVDDLDAAIDWARRMPERSGVTVEVRAALSGLPWQRVLTE
jgi:hypothetical protein